MKKKLFTLISQGCRLNHSETAGLVNEFKAHGYNEVGLESNPELIVVNTCTVTENGDKDTIKLVRKINSSCSNPNIALIGCQSQIKKDALLKLENVNWVVGNENKETTVSLITQNKPGLYVKKIEKKPFFQSFSSFDPKHTRVNLKIQDGCDFYCSFCIIPFARGPARSRDFNNIIDDAKGLINLGVKEIVLTGINLGTYENNGYGFYELLEALLKISPTTRIRISSIEPTTIDIRLIEYWIKYPNFCKYLHLPIQSATDDILRSMRRKYTVKDYMTYIDQIRKSIPEICIGTDVIVGFPGESNQLFKETYDQLSKSEINYFHVFSYSERQMAHARKFTEQVERSEIKKRSELLRNLHSQRWQKYMKSKVNQNANVLFEQKKQGAWIGTTENFIKVKVDSNQNLKNKLCQINLTSVEHNNMLGELI
ncbi:MAG: tRNA (N(6)-L-threonylcarbamoyladenosine(37)-C(2))-methylthiotransferase MtaB [Candidatus Margulisiibacteriota bacterium]